MAALTDLNNLLRSGCTVTIRLHEDDREYEVSGRGKHTIHRRSGALYTVRADSLLHGAHAVASLPTLDAALKHVWEQEQLGPVPEEAAESGA